MMTQDKYFSRQILLRDLGESGQKKLLESKVAVIGAGGLGHPALVSLALAGVGTLKIIDNDTVDMSNLHRQFLFSPKDQGQNKCQVVADNLISKAPFLKVEIKSERLKFDNAQELLQGMDLILDCSDNFDTKFLIHDICHFLKIPLIQASVYQYEGQILFFDANNSGNPCFRCLYPVKLENGCVGSCGEVGVLGATVMILGAMQGALAIEALLGRQNLKAGEVLTFDLKSFEMVKHSFAKNKSCPCCSHGPTLADIKKQYEHEEIISHEEALEAMRDYVWIDLRTQEEIKESDYQRLRGVEIHTLINQQGLLESLDENKKYIFFCRKGQRSQKLVKELRERKFKNVYSLENGLPFS